MSLQKKGDIVINPKTQRPVRVGSRTWNKLVKEGIFEGRYSDPNELADKYEEIPDEQLKLKINEINKKLPKGTHAVRGRGKYAGKIVKRNKQPTPREMSEYMAKTASRLLLEKEEELDEIPSEDIEAELEAMILTEIAGTKRERKQESQKRIEHEKYYLNQVEEDDEDDEVENEEEDEEDED